MRVCACVCVRVCTADMKACMLSTWCTAGRSSAFRCHGVHALPVAVQTDLASESTLSVAPLPAATEGPETVTPTQHWSPHLAQLAQSLQPAVEQVEQAM